MKKILFFIPTLLGGGAEKVLVNLVNSMDPKEYDVTVLTLCNVGINRSELNKNINYNYVFKRNIKAIRHILKIFSPSFLAKKMIKGNYDCIVSYLEGPTTRIISGCKSRAKKIAWIHTENIKDFDVAFRSKEEMIRVYNNFKTIICVSTDVKNSFNKFTNDKFQNKIKILKNITNPYSVIEKAIPSFEKDENIFRIITVGRLDANKDQIRMLNIIDKLNIDGHKVELLIVGNGCEYKKIKNKIKDLNLANVYMLGYQSNPYKYIASSDLYVCCSHKEGYSTTTIESLILNIPIVTTNCSGMKEILENGKYGLIVNDDDKELYFAIKKLTSDSKLYAKIKNNQIKKVEKLKKEFLKNVEKVEDLF